MLLITSANVCLCVYIIIVNSVYLVSVISKKCIDSFMQLKENKKVYAIISLKNILCIAKNRYRIETKNVACI